MPSCKHCSYTAATSAFRKSPKGGHVCLDKRGCAHDKKIRAAGQEPGPRSLQALLRF